MSDASAPKSLAVADFYADKERYFISSGKQIGFWEIPTSNYRLAQTLESIKTMGSLWQLNPSASDDATTDTTWDVFTRLPSFAARYDSPLVSGNDSKTIYWEFEILSLGYEGKSTGVGFGFMVRDGGSEAIAGKSTGSLRPADNSSPPISLSGPSLLWWSVDGAVYDNGNKIGTKTFAAQPGDTVGLGVTFEFDSEIPMIPTRDVTDNPTASASKLSRSLDRKGNKTARVAEAKDLVACPTNVFVTINGVKTDLEGDIARDFLSGCTDVFPVLVVSGPGVSGKTRIGEAVKFDGDGGAVDAQVAAKGNANKAGYKESKWSKLFGAGTGGGGLGAFGGGW